MERQTCDDVTSVPPVIREILFIPSGGRIIILINNDNITASEEPDSAALKH